MSKNMVCAFVNTMQDPLNVKHICYYTTDGIQGNEIALCEVIEAIYPHPDAPDESTIKVTQTQLVRTMKRLDYKAAYVVLMEAQQNNCKIIEDQK